MAEPDRNTMNADQKLEELYQLFHALVIEVGDLGVKLSRIQSGLDEMAADFKHTADRVSALEVRAAIRLN
jgi:hypothetical protein